MQIIYSLVPLRGLFEATVPGLKPFHLEDDWLELAVDVVLFLAVGFGR